tara:strand:- start:3530 stop:3868 length:339 start_codon:yes stop_codon:yes gene_type:complete
MASRYGKRNIFLNNDVTYSKKFKDRGIRSIKHYSTAELKYPTSSELEDIVINVEIFKVGDRYYKFAQKYYNDATYWWVIAQFNQKPTENMLNLGDTVYIPTPLTKILEFLEE